MNSLSAQSTPRHAWRFLQTGTSEWLSGGQLASQMLYVCTASD
jgi:hypothetical protein